MIKSLKTIGLQQQKQGYKDSDKDYVDDKNDKWPGKNDKIARREAIQDVAGTLVGEYYQDKKGFAQNNALVKEMQDDLVRLGYDLGTSGKDKNGVDGKLGAKTVQAFHNFELDHKEEIKEAAAIQKAIPKGSQR